MMLESFFVILFTLIYIFIRWTFNFCLRLIIWGFSVIVFCLTVVIRIIGLDFISDATEFLCFCENKMGEWFAINPLKFLSVQRLLGINRNFGNSNSYYSNFALNKSETATVNIPHPPEKSLSDLKKGILNIVSDSNE